MVGPNDNRFTPNQIKQLKDAIRESTSNLGLGAKDVKILGGFADFFDEGNKMYESKKQAIINTGKLLDAITDEEGGLVGRLTKITEGSFQYFGQIDEGIKAVQSLTENLRSFSMIGSDVQGQLVTQAALFEKLGVSMSDFSEVIDSARLGFKMTGKEAAELSRQVAGIGNATGVGMGKAMANFRSAQSSMAYDTKKLMENFKGLQLTAAQTGVGFDRLTSAFGQSMDTFEGSANKAGTLNAILGRSVFNSIDLLGKTEAERVSTIIKGIRESVDVQALSKNKFQLKAIAAGLDLSVDETRKLLSGQMSVDDALSLKEKSDPRETALKKMAQLLEENVNPQINDFGKMLEKIRPLQDQAVVDFNTSMRNMIAQATGDTDFSSPAKIYEFLERAGRSITDERSLEAYKGQIGNFSKVFEDAKAEMGKPDANKEEILKEAFRNAGSILKNIKNIVPSTNEIAATTGTQAEKAAALNKTDLNSPAYAVLKLLKQTVEALNPAMQTINRNVQGIGDPNLGTKIFEGATFIIQIGDKTIDGAVKAVKVKK